MFHGFRFEILGRQRNQITSIKVLPLDQVGDPGADEESEAKAGTGAREKASDSGPAE